MRYLLIIIVLLVVVLAALFTVPLGSGKPLLDWQHVEWTSHCDRQIAVVAIQLPPCELLCVPPGLSALEPEWYAKQVLVQRQ